MKSFWLPCLIALWLPITGGDAAPADKPNILLIFADDIGYEALNCYGGLDFETPTSTAWRSKASVSPAPTPARSAPHRG
jgi:arylsulfatase A